MLLMHFDSNGNLTTIEQVPDLPDNFECLEWKAYDAACDEAQAAGLSWTEKQAQTYAAYHEAQKRNFQ